MIDAIVSDHRPQDQDSKRVPFAQAEPGGIGLETLLPISLELVHNGHLTLPRCSSAVEHAGAAVRPARRQARQGRAGRPRAVRRRLCLEGRSRRSLEQDQELAVRRAAGAGPGHGDHRRRPHHLPRRQFHAGCRGGLTPRRRPKAASKRPFRLLLSAFHDRALMMLRQSLLLAAALIGVRGRGRRAAARPVARRPARRPDPPHPDLRRDHRHPAAPVLLRPAADPGRRRAGAGAADADAARQQSAARAAAVRCAADRHGHRRSSGSCRSAPRRSRRQPLGRAGRRRRPPWAAPSPASMATPLGRRRRIPTPPSIRARADLSAAGGAGAQAAAAMRRTGPRPVPNFVDAAAAGDAAGDQPDLRRLRATGRSR